MFIEHSIHQTSNRKKKLMTKNTEIHLLTVQIDTLEKAKCEYVGKIVL